MLRKKKVLAIAGVACIIVASLYVVYVAASPAWDIDDMVAWMENPGKKWIGRITRWTREIREKMGQGLVGEFEEGSVKTEYDWVTLWEYFPEGKPKKVSLYVDLWEMSTGDGIWILTEYYIKGHSVMLGDQVSYDGTTTKTMMHVFLDDQTYDGKLILDQLPVATHIKVYVIQGLGTLFTVHYQVIIEEV